jgi:hypothetical protein
MVKKEHFLRILEAFPAYEDTLKAISKCRNTKNKVALETAVKTNCRLSENQLSFD